MRSRETEDIIRGIIGEGIHHKEFYTSGMIEDLAFTLDEIKKDLKVEGKDTREITTAVKEFVMENIAIRKEFFTNYTPEENIYRTAYSAILMGESTCRGYTELTRIMLAMHGIESTALVSKLPGAWKQICHYVCTVEHDDGEVELVDAEREMNCIKKGTNFNDYAKDMIFLLPDDNFIQHKMDNNTTGIPAEEYLAMNPNQVHGHENLKELVKEKEMCL